MQLVGASFMKKLPIPKTQEFGIHIYQNLIFRVAYSITQFLFTALLIRLLGPGGNGNFTLLVTNCAFYTLLLGFGLDAGIIFHISKNDFSLSRLLATVIMVILPFQLVISLTGEGLVHAVTGHSVYINGLYMRPWIWGTIYMAGLLMNFYGMAFLNARKRFRLIYTTLLCINLVALVFLVLADLIFKNLHVQFLIGIFIVINCISGITLTIINFKSAGWKNISLLRAAEYGRLFRYSGIVFWANIIQFLAYRADIWIINYFLGKGQLGIYALSAKLIQLFWLVPVAISTVVFSYSDRMEDPRWLEDLKVLLRLLAWGSFIGAMLLCIFGHQFIIVFFGASFGSAMIPLVILLPGSLIYIYNIILASYFSGMNKVIINLIGSVICVVVIVSLDFALIPHWGIRGAALASSIGYGASGIYAMVMFRKRHPLGWVDLVALRRMDLKYLAGYFHKNPGQP
jgi:O-antigen/teichoic acid export membrane protein